MCLWTTTDTKTIVVHRAILTKTILGGHPLCISAWPWNMAGNDTQSSQIAACKLLKTEMKNTYKLPCSQCKSIYPMNKAAIYMQ